jgi:hypothetical protein
MNLMTNIASEVDQSGRPRADASGRVFAVMTSFEAPGKGFDAFEPISGHCSISLLGPRAFWRLRREQQDYF